MAQSLENKFASNGSILGYPNNPAQPLVPGTGPSPEAVGSTIHNQYSYDGNPPSNVAAPRYSNVGNPTSLPEPTSLQPFTGPQNGVAAGAGFNTYNSQNNYDSFVLSQGGIDRI